MTEPADTAPRCPARLPMGPAGTRCQLAPHTDGGHLHLYTGGPLAWLYWQDATPPEAPGSTERPPGPGVGSEPSPRAPGAGRAALPPKWWWLRPPPGR